MSRLLVYLVTVIFCVTKTFAQSEPFYFIQLSDPQFGMLEKNKSFSQETKIMEKVVAVINNLNPAFVVITGDMVNDGEDQNQINEFKRICTLIKKNIPVYVLPGNHDLNQQSTDESISCYMDEYGYDCFCFHLNNSCFIGLNTPIIFANREEKEKKQLVWLEKNLENSQKCNHCILFGHYPFFVKEPNETNRYENIPIKKRKIYLDLMDKYRVSNMFAGHLHYNAMSSYGNFNITITNSICTPLGEDRIGIRIVKVYPDKIVHDYYDLDQIPSNITL